MWKEKLSLQGPFPISRETPRSVPGNRRNHLCLRIDLPYPVVAGVRDIKISFLIQRDPPWVIQPGFRRRPSISSVIPSPFGTGRLRQSGGIKNLPI
jgi:hypothetical protein